MTSDASSNTPQKRQSVSSTYTSVLRVSIPSRLTTVKAFIMRLLQRRPDSDGFSLTEYVGDDIPRYAILSHTWGQDSDEVTFKDVVKGRGTNKSGYRKLSFCSKQAATDGLDFFWVDTCCIDKTSSAELAEAINSMFKWYQKAEKCYVYLTDVSITRPITEITQRAWGQIFEDSRWFKRGWTLQELLAPKDVEFYSKEEMLIGNKNSLQQAVHTATGLPVLALENSTLLEFSVDERMSWVDCRATKREEDRAYSLLGIFNVHMPLIYGEGHQNAFARLRKEIEGSLGIKSSAKPPPAWTVPFGRDADFVSRKGLDRVCQICAPPAGRASLVGLGGIGKSQIAIEYTYRTRDRSPAKWIFWVHAGTRARFEEGYRRIAEATKPEGWDDPKANILRLVRSWLCDESNGEWTMVIDNADDATVFFPSLSQYRGMDDPEQQAEVLSDYLPQSPNGSILITSRNQFLAEKLTGTSAGVIQVMPMDEDDALSLLGKKLGYAATGKEAVELVNMLEAMPLALTQAAAFIRQRAPRMSISKYLENVRRSDKDQARILGKDVGDSRRDSRASNSILSTWQISFEHIREHMPSAAHLLSLMSMFDRQGIPESLLQDQYDSEQEEGADFDDDIQTLSDFSLIRMSADGSEFETHRLVQIATKKWLERHDELEEWKGTYANLMEVNYPVAEFENWKICQSLFPHVQAMLDNKPQQADAIRAWAKVINNASDYVLGLGEFNKAAELNAISLEALEDILGPEHNDTLFCLTRRGEILRSQGQYAEAEVITEKALSVKRRVLGKDHKDTLISISGLASIYYYQGRYTEAESVQISVVHQLRTRFGEDRLDTLANLSTLASIYSKQDRHAEAESLQTSVLHLRTKLLGKDHPDTLSSMNDIALTYRDQGRYDEAESLLLSLLDRRTDEFGKDHPDTFTAINNLALIYFGQGRYAEAESLQLSVVQLLTTKLGKDHPKTLSSMESLAETYMQQERWSEAEALRVTALAMRKVRLGPYHPSTLECLGKLSRTYMKLDLWEKVEETEKELLTLQIKCLGEKHEETLETMESLAGSWAVLGRLEDAIELQRRCVPLMREVFGKEHPKFISSRDALEEWKEWEEEEKEWEEQGKEDQETEKGTDTDAELEGLEKSVQQLEV